MPKLKPLSSKKFISIILKLGYNFHRQRGSHAIFVKGENLVTVPIHSGNKLDRNLVLKIIKKELKITREEFEKLL